VVGGRVGEWWCLSFGLFHHIHSFLTRTENRSLPNTRKSDYAGHSIGEAYGAFK
jgi:hypothetical protein